MIFGIVERQPTFMMTISHLIKNGLVTILIALSLMVSYADAAITFSGVPLYHTAGAQTQTHYINLRDNAVIPAPCNASTYEPGSCRVSVWSTVGGAIVNENINLVTNSMSPHYNKFAIRTNYKAGTNRVTLQGYIFYSPSNQVTQNVSFNVTGVQPAIDAIKFVTSGTRAIGGTEYTYANKSSQIFFQVLASRVGSSSFDESVIPSSLTESSSNASIINGSTAGRYYLKISDSLPGNETFTLNASVPGFTASRTVRARAILPEKVTIFRDGSEVIVDDIPDFDENLSNVAQYTARFNYSDDSWINITPEWSTPDLNIATINSSGQLSTGEVTKSTGTYFTAKYEFNSTSSYYPEYVGREYSATRGFIINNNLSLEIEGASAVDDSNKDGYLYIAIASMVDGPHQVNPAEWVVTDLNGVKPSFADIDELGILTTDDVSAAVDVIVKATFTYKGETVVATQSVTINNSDKGGLTDIFINGPTVLNSGSSEVYALLARYGDGSTSSSNVVWSISGSDAVSIDAAGLVTVNTVNSQNQIATIHALYSDGGVTKTAEILVSIVGDPYLSYVIERVSGSKNGPEPDGHSYDVPSLSDDGRYVAFTSNSTNLLGIDEDTNDSGDIYVYDRVSGDMERVSDANDGTQSNSFSRYPVISGDGRYVAFQSRATNLFGIGESNNNIHHEHDVYLYDRYAVIGSRLVRVSDANDGAQSNGSSKDASISFDGRYIAFGSSATNLIGANEDSNNRYDVYLYDRDGGSGSKLVRVSDANNNTQANSGSFDPSISGDGRYVAFESYAMNLLAPGEDTNTEVDIYLYDRDKDNMERISDINSGSLTIGANDGTQANAANYAPSVSDDGRYVVFESAATNLLGPGEDTNGDNDIYLYDRKSRTTARVADANDGAQSNNSTRDPVISGDGLSIVFNSSASNLLGLNGDTNGEADFFVATPKSPTSVAIQLVTPTALVSVGEKFSVDVSIDSGNLTTVGGGLNINYDTSLLDFVSFTPNPALVLDSAFGRDPDITTTGITLNGLAFGEFEGLKGLYSDNELQPIGTLIFKPLTSGIAELSVSDNSLTGPMGSIYLVDGSAPSVINYTGTTVTISENAAPVVLGVSIVTDMGVAHSGSMIGDDTDGDQLTYQLVIAPEMGTVDIDNPTTGAFTYTPYAGLIGLDIFTYQASDGKQTSLPATVSVTINENTDVPPVASNGVISTDEDVLFINGTLVATDADSPVLTYRIGSNGQQGTAVIIDANAGTFNYTPNPNANGPDSFTFIANDGTQDSNTATISVTINPVNDAPVPGDNNFSEFEDQSFSGTLAVTDVDGDALSYSIVSQGALGGVVINDTATGAFTYTPTLNANGDGSFTFSVTDGAIPSPLAATATVTLAAVNDAPVAIDGNLIIDQDTAGNGSLAPLASDVDGDSLLYFLDPLTSGLLGTVAIDNVTGAYTYTPNTGISGTDTFGFYVNDGALDSNIATVTVTINTAAPPPPAGADVVYEYDVTQRIGGTSLDYATGSAVDVAGNLYVTGYFAGTVDFDPSAGSDPHSSAGHFDIYVTRQNADGSYGWTRTFGGTDADYAQGVTVDSLGDIYVTGNFYGSVDFDPTAAVDNHTSAGNYDAYITKLYSDGRYGWTRTIGGSSIDYGMGITVDSFNNIYTTGFFAGSIDFDPTTGVDNRSSGAGYDAFITKLLPDGSYGWSEIIGGNGNNYGYAIAIDAADNIYLSGQFSGLVDFDNGPGLAKHTSNGGFDVFVTKLQADRSHLWTQVFGGATADDYSYGIAVDDLENVYLTGTFVGSVDFDSDAVNSDLHTSNGKTDAYLVKFNADGTYGWARTHGGSENDYGFTVAIDSVGHVLMGGGFAQTVDFDPGTGNDSHTAKFYTAPAMNSGVASTDIYLTRYKNDGRYDWTYVPEQGTSRHDMLRSIAVTSDGGFYLVGDFNYSAYSYAYDSYRNIDFDPDPAVFEWHTASRYNDVFVSRWVSHPDTDGDGVMDSLDAFPNDPTEWRDADGDGIGNHADPDDDNDGLTDLYEISVGLNPLSAGDGEYDADGDGLSNLQELQLTGTNRLVTDTDGDGMSDGFEVTYGLDPLDGSDGALDSDGDGLSNLDEFYRNSDPTVNDAALSYDLFYGGTSIIGGAYHDYVGDIAVDDSGNIYLTGFFREPVDFDPGVGVDLQYSLGNYSQFVTRLNADGSYGWTRVFNDDAGSSMASSIAVDAAGNVYIGSRYDGTEDFDPGVGVDLHTAMELYDGYLMKLNSDGSYGWTQSFSGPLFTYVKSIDLDANGNIYLTGSFRGIMDFDPGVGIDEHKGRVGYQAGDNLFVTMINADGSYGWTRTVQSTGRGISGNHLKVDAYGNIFVAGVFYQSADFDPTSGEDIQVASNDSHYHDTYLMQLLPNGDYGWARVFGSSGVYEAVNDLNINDQGAVYITGAFSGTVDFDPTEGVESFSTNTYPDAYLSKYNADGRYQWTRKFGGGSADYGYSVVTGQQGEVFVGGAFKSTVDFNPDGGDSHTSAGRADLFLTKVHADGSYGWTHTAGSDRQEYLKQMAVGSNGNLYTLTESLESYRTADYDPGPGVDYVPKIGGYDIYFTQWHYRLVPQ